MMATDKLTKVWNTEIHTIENNAAVRYIQITNECIGGRARFRVEVRTNWKPRLSGTFRSYDQDFPTEAEARADANRIWKHFKDNQDV